MIENDLNIIAMANKYVIAFHGLCELRLLLCEYILLEPTTGELLALPGDGLLRIIA